MEGHDLPSGGAIYDVDVNPHIELRSMTTRDEMKRTAPSTTPYKVLADLIEDCCIEKPAIHVYDMAFGDYEYLLHRLRCITYGDEYKMAIICPNCQRVIEATAHLDDLTTKDFDQEQWDNLKSITLSSGDVIELNYMTPRMTDNIALQIADRKKKAKGASADFSVLVQLMHIIDTVNGAKLSQSKLETYAMNLAARDVMAIINGFDKLNTCLGITNELEVHCDECGEDVITYFRGGQEFFRPSNI